MKPPQGKLYSSKSDEKCSQCGDEVSPHGSSRVAVRRRVAATPFTRSVWVPYKLYACVWQAYLALTD
jgi:hypothetical protein